ncbi:MAG: hypothetical protein BWZ03_00094 [bacterium ADurb.BinA186]|nr:MAG: hypothetical protein BWZ03_00094 [bacterium ADurb.BinA186]
MKLRILDSRSKIDESVDVLTDLDALVDQPIYFRLQGRTYKIKPMNTEQCFIAWSQFSKLDALIKAKEVSMTDAIEVYADLFESVVEDFDRKIVRDMTQAQCGALLKLVFDSVSGKAQAEVKKKAIAESNLTGIPLQSVKSIYQPSLAKRVASTAGRLTMLGKCLLGASLLCIGLCVGLMLLRS